MNTYTALKLIQANNGIVTSKIIRDLISEYSEIHRKMKLDYDHYKAEHLPIHSREPKKQGKPNNKLNNDYRGEIVDQGIGYLFGKPITYRLKKEAYSDNESGYESDRLKLQEFLKTSFIEDLDTETGKKGSVCGVGTRLCYVDKQGQERVMNIPPWEVILIYDASLDVVQYALRYYEIQQVEGDAVRTRTRVEWYDYQTVTYYISDNNKNYILDINEPNNPQLHMFDKVPIIEFPNNEEHINDFKKVEANIDAYDKTLSIIQDEIEEFRNAYLAFIGCSVDKETIKMLEETGALSLPGDGADAKFLIKDLNGEYFEKHKKTLKENIYRFSKTVDMTAETFAGYGASGETRKWLLLALEFRAGIQALKFSKGLTQMFQVLTTAWEKKKITLSWKNIEFTFDRNMPAELKQESEIQSVLNGVISDRTRLSLFSAVRDVDEEIKQMEKENDLKVDLDAVNPDETVNPEASTQ